MKLRKFLSGVGITSLIVTSAFTFSSCTPKITQEQLLQLKDLYNKERSVTDAIAKKKTEKSRLEQELGSRKAELKKCEDEKAFIQDKLAKWPNCWPDWTPEAPAENK
ncbi:MAG: hypothetical protein WCT77_10380 [Bacteroidota bacterium]